VTSVTNLWVCLGYVEGFVPMTGWVKMNEWLSGDGTPSTGSGELGFGWLYSNAVRGIDGVGGERVSVEREERGTGPPIAAVVCEEMVRGTAIRRCAVL
jgi:hypothetical protein